MGEDESWEMSPEKSEQGRIYEPWCDFEFCPMGNGKSLINLSKSVK